MSQKKTPYRRTDGAAGLGGISVVGDPYKKSDPTRTCRRIYFFLLDNDCLRFFFSLLSFFYTFSLRFVISGVFNGALLRPKKKQERKKNGGHFALYEDDEMDSV